MCRSLVIFFYKCVDYFLITACFPHSFLLCCFLILLITQWNECMCALFENSHLQSCELMHVERPCSSTRMTRYRTAVMFTVHTEIHDLSETAVSTDLTFMQQFHNSKALERKERSPLRALISQENLEMIFFFCGGRGTNFMLASQCGDKIVWHAIHQKEKKKKVELCVKEKNKPKINFRMLQKEIK